MPPVPEAVPPVVPPVPFTVPVPFPVPVPDVTGGGGVHVVEPATQPPLVATP